MHILPIALTLLASSPTTTPRGTHPSCAVDEWRPFVFHKAEDDLVRGDDGVYDGTYALYFDGPEAAQYETGITASEALAAGSHRALLVDIKGETVHLTDIREWIGGLDSPTRFIPSSVLSVLPYWDLQGIPGFTWEDVAKRLHEASPAYMSSTSWALDEAPMRAIQVEIDADIDRITQLHLDEIDYTPEGFIPISPTIIAVSRDVRARCHVESGVTSP